MDKNKFEHTTKFDVKFKDGKIEARQLLLNVYASLKEKGYNPINQLVGYLLSGDPTYITSHNNARSMICQLERDELLEDLVREYLKELDKR